MPKTRPNRPIAPTWIQCAKGGTGMTRSHRGTAEPVVFIGFFHGYALYRQTKKSQKKVAKKLAKHFAKIGAAVQPNLAKLAAKHELHARVGAYRATNAWWRPVPWWSEDLKKNDWKYLKFNPKKIEKKIMKNQQFLTFIPVMINQMSPLYWSVVQRSQRLIR